MNIIVGIGVTLAVVMAFALLHEMFHYLTAKALGMKVKIIPKWWGFYVYMPETSGKKWNELPKEVKRKYNLIAISPYIVFVPLFSLLALHFSNISYPIFSICMALLVVNFISLPMEWMVK